MLSVIMQKNAPEIVHSPAESDILGLKVGRVSMLRSTSFDTDHLQRQIITKGFDLARIQVNSRIRDIYIQLDQLNMPYYPLSKVNMFRADPRYVPEEQKQYRLEFIPYRMEMKKVLVDIVSKSFKNKAGSFYLNPLLSTLVSEEQHLKAMSEYAATFDETVDKAKRCFLCRYDGKFVAFISFHVSDEIVESVLQGILPQYQGLGFSREMYAYCLSYFREIGKRILVPIQIHNTPSLKLCHRYQFTPYLSVINVHINSFFSKTQLAVKEIDITLSDKVSIIPMIMEHVSNHFCEYDEIRWVKQHLQDTFQQRGSYRLKITFPIRSPRQALILTKVFDLRDELVGYVYLFLRKPKSR